MKNEKLKVIYQDENLIVINKPAGIICFLEKEINKKTLINELLEKFPDLKNVGNPPRYGTVHRLDKDTSGIILIAKNNKALDFFQKQFKDRNVTKKYIALVIGEIQRDKGKIETLIGRSQKNKKKQKAYLFTEPEAQRKGLREAITEYKILEKFKEYTLVEIQPKTGRKHQIRCHFTFLNHPIVGDKIYSFKNPKTLKNLKRQFLHASYLKIKLLNKKEKEFKSEIPNELNQILKNLK